ncbi:MAG: DNA polymerase III subunit gamma/tau [Eubacteriales bacterium]|nr:DNA polymerase III subunit gamma/tau [Eubacteriales bacterium]
MAHVSLYRKYRPTSFDTMIGQRHIVRTLKNTILSGKISHAYLFTGTRGTGKTTTAKIFARAINCLNPREDGSPCETCEVCKALSAPNCLDIIEMDAASNNGVDDIRDLREKVKFPPSVGKYKVYIIDEVHMLSQSAFNALLKTLEEPPQHAVFILATTEVDKIPQTILSRCMRLDFKLLNSAELVDLLKKIFEEEGREYQKEALQLIAEAGDGSVRDCLSIADICMSYCEGQVGYDDVLEVLGASSPTMILELVEALVKSDVRSALETVEKIIGMGKNVSLLAKDVAKTLRNVVFAKNCVNANKILGLPIEIYNRLVRLGDACSNDKLVHMVDVFMDIEGQLKYSNSAQVVVEMAVVKACDLFVSIDTDGIIKRLKDVESKVRTLISLDSNQSNERFQLDVGEVWGRLLNILNKNKSMIVAYNAANDVDTKTQLSYKDNVLVITVFSDKQFAVLDYFASEFKSIICKEYFEITDVKIVLDNKIDEVEQGIAKITELVGDNKITIKKGE